MATSAPLCSCGKRRWGVHLSQARARHGRRGTCRQQVRHQCVLSARSPPSCGRKPVFITPRQQSPASLSPPTGQGLIFPRGAVQLGARDVASSPRTPGRALTCAISLFSWALPRAQVPTQPFLFPSYPTPWGGLGAQESFC